MTSTTIRFYFDYISPNAYLAWIQLPKLAGKYGCTIDPVPVLFAGLLGAHGQLGPAEIPAKALWMAKNNYRKAVQLGVPLNPPAFHPFNPLLALRVSSLPLETAKRAALITALFEAVWVRGLHVSETAIVERIGDEISLSGSALVAPPRSKTTTKRSCADRPTTPSPAACSVCHRWMSLVSSSGGSTTSRSSSCFSPGKIRRRRSRTGPVGLARRRFGADRRSDRVSGGARAQAARVTIDHVKPLGSPVVRCPILGYMVEA
ncbi:MAG TPA: DsbA family protein, partial [Mycobacterium sp.]|nr:DsbA family protein [Mycobacterium sp.]